MRVHPADAGRAERKRTRRGGLDLEDDGAAGQWSRTRGGAGTGDPCQGPRGRVEREEQRRKPVSDAGESGSYPPRLLFYVRNEREDMVVAGRFRLVGATVVPGPEPLGVR